MRSRHPKKFEISRKSEKIVSKDLFPCFLKVIHVLINKNNLAL